jgi:uncharacterized membrane protein YgdD (TMEM256/DUF423 family)
MNWSVAGALLMALGVALGAFGAHGLKDRLDAYRMSVYEKAVFYHFVHALGVLIVSVLPKTGTFSEFATDWVCTLLVAGIVLFSGSLYLLALTGNRWLGAITPVGGVSFIAAWVMLAWFVARR